MTFGLSLIDKTYDSCYKYTRKGYTTNLAQHTVLKLFELSISYKFGYRSIDVTIFDLLSYGEECLIKE
jgi:hypothetical protein